MGKIVPIVIAVVMVSFLFTPSRAEEDTRTVVSLKPEIRERFLKEMRGHMETLDDLVAAIGSGDFKEAASIAGTRLDFGHHMWEAMAARGATAEEIAAMKERVRAMGMGSGRGAAMSDEEHMKMEESMAKTMGGGMGMGRGMGRGMGIGRYMPPEFRDMGRSMHAAGGELATVLQGAAEPPTRDDYQAALKALSNVTTVCRACHDTFKVE